MMIHQRLQTSNGLAPPHWSADAAKFTGVALSTTSLAVVYAVLVETGLTHTTLGKLIMPARSSPTSARPRP